MSKTETEQVGRRVSFACITDETRDCLRALWPVVEAHLDDILRRFYKHVMSEPALKNLVGSRQASLESAQKAHWGRLFHAAFDQEYVDSINRIGRAHVRIGLEPRWYIAGYQFVLNELVAIVVRKYRLSPKRLTVTIQAMNRAVMLDLDYAISTYQEILMEAQENRTKTLKEAVDRFQVKVDGALQAVGNTADQVGAGAGNLKAVANAASEEALSASAVSEQTSCNVQTVAAAAEELASSIVEIARQISGASDVARRATGITDNASSEVGLLSVTAQKIGDVIGLIQAIAEQTNLLALNATIEAARAGEAGRGFAIVAQEVKQLAGQTSKATEDIAKQVSEVQAATTRAVATIGSIASTVGEIDSLTAAIAAAVEEQGAATREISINVQQAAQGTSTLNRNVSSVSDAIEKTEGAATSFLVVSSDLQGHAKSITKDIRDFFSDIRRLQGEDTKVHVA
jgi:methyl-accepting chemotaxis protein